MRAERQDFKAETKAETAWLSVAIGNSRVLWGQWHGSTLTKWGRAQIAPNPEFKREVQSAGDRVWFASVGNNETAFDLWPALQRSRQLSLADVPLSGIYNTLGLDRALALVGAASEYGWPVLVVDGGTALTFTGANEAGLLVGGAIAPGLALQTHALHSSTAALPEVHLTGNAAVERWAKTTELAIESGVVLGAIAAVRSFCEDWRQHYPHSAIAFAGGDGEYLQKSAAIPNSVCDPVLILRGMAACRWQWRLSQDESAATATQSDD